MREDSANRVSRSWVTITTVSSSSRCSDRISVTKPSDSVRIEPRGGLVQEQQLRIQRQRARQRRALDHAARQVGRHLVGVLRLQADHLQLDQHGVADQRLRAAARSSRIGRAMLSNTLNAENSAPCWNSMPQRLRMRCSCAGRPR